MKRIIDILKHPAVIGYLVLAVAVTIALFRVDDAIDGQERTDEKLEQEAAKRTEAANKFFEAIVVAQMRECRQDHSLRVQYKIRGENQENLLEGAIALLTPPHTSEEAEQIEIFQRGLKDIKILPVPNCQKAKKDLVEHLPFPDEEAPDPPVAPRQDP